MNGYNSIVGTDWRSGYNYYAPCLVQVRPDNDRRQTGCSFNGMRNKSGVYVITNLTTGKFYIGSSVNLPARKKNHWSKLRHNRHDNPYLQNAFNKYGEDDFTFLVLLYCECPDCSYYEQAIMDIFHPHYNMGPALTPFLGRTHSPATIHKMKEWIAFNRKPASEETRRRIGAASRARITTDEARKHIGDAHRGKKRSAEMRKKISEANRRRQIDMSPEARAKRSAAHRGSLTPEHRAKISEGLKRREPPSEETRKKISLALKGRQVSPETRRKQSLAQKKRFARRDNEQD